MNDAGSRACGAPPRRPRDFTPQPLGEAATLAERGAARAFDLKLWGQPAQGFAVKVDGRVRAYVNRCAHVPIELDWQPGAFWDTTRETLICATHGASYSPHDGRCLGGPCGGGRLLAIEVHEHQGQLHWLPTEDIQPPGGADASRALSTGGPRPASQS